MELIAPTTRSLPTTARHVLSIRHCPVHRTMQVLCTICSMRYSDRETIRSVCKSCVPPILDECISEHATTGNRRCLRSSRLHCARCSEAPAALPCPHKITHRPSDDILSIRTPEFLQLLWRPRIPLSTSIQTILQPSNSQCGESRASSGTYMLSTSPCRHRRKIVGVVHDDGPQSSWSTGR